MGWFVMYRLYRHDHGRAQGVSNSPSLINASKAPPPQDCFFRRLNEQGFVSSSDNANGKDTSKSSADVWA